MGKADRYIENYRNKNTQLNPFKNRTNCSFLEIVEHKRNSNKFIEKLSRKKK